MSSKFWEEIELQTLRIKGRNYGENKMAEVPRNEVKSRIVYCFFWGER
jgi:hypothetical protein